jgi:acetone carboxylase gamma subunit
MGDFPLRDCYNTASKLVDEGHTVYQKFTCGKCGERQTIDDPNAFYTSGKCEECGHVTDIEKAGCNYLLVMGKRRQTK